VPPRLGQQTILDDHTDPETPLERRTTALLARALEATEGAGRAAGAANDIGPFRAREREGVSANLCDAVAELIEATTADVVRASIAFASRRPAVIALPRSAAFSADLAPILRQAAVQLREEATYAAIEVVGVIVKLESDNADVGGVAVMRANIEDRMRHVRIPMEREPYQRAIQAHAERSLVQCTGDLSRQGRDWVLGNARDLAVVDVRA
jgi:hypothetical protein